LNRIIEQARNPPLDFARDNPPGFACGYAAASNPPLDFARDNPQSVPARRGNPQSHAVFGRC
jgi:hypothetical protein